MSEMLQSYVRGLEYDIKRVTAIAAKERNPLRKIKLNARIESTKRLVAGLRATEESP